MIFTTVEDQFNAVALWMMQVGKWNLALKVYEELLALLETKEIELGIRIHKGLAYYNIGLCYDNQTMPDFVRALICFQMAYDEDVLTYGPDKAKKHLAYSAIQYMNRKGVK